jgi:hypothetical protein
MILSFYSPSKYELHTSAFKKLQHHEMNYPEGVNHVMIE